MVLVFRWMSDDAEYRAGYTNNLIKEFIWHTGKDPSSQDHFSWTSGTVSSFFMPATVGTDAQNAQTTWLRIWPHGGPDNEGYLVIPDIRVTFGPAGKPMLIIRIIELNKWKIFRKNRWSLLQEKYIRSLGRRRLLRKHSIDSNYKLTGFEIGGADRSVYINYDGFGIYSYCFCLLWWWKKLFVWCW